MYTILDLGGDANFIVFLIYVITKGDRSLILFYNVGKYGFFATIPYVPMLSYKHFYEPITAHGRTRFAD